MAAVIVVCHVTNMTRRHGNIKRECYKITVALKKNNDIIFEFHASYYDTAALLISLFLNFLLFYVYSLYFRYNLLL